MIDIIKTPPKRIEKKIYGTSYTKIYIFDCFNCGKNEIRSEKKYLKKHSGKCRSCCQRGIPYKGSYNHLKDSVKRTNKRRKKQKTFTLTFDEFLEFIKIKNCHYCNESIHWVKHSGMGQYKYNLDRKDSNIGYEKDNLVVCCKTCNYMKGAEFSYNEFKEVVKLINKMRNNTFIKETK